MTKRTLLAGICAAALGLAQAAAAHAQPVFPVMNTSESPPDGVWFRYGPDAAQTNRVTGVGVYMNEHVVVKCYWHGTPFGGYHNDVWYYAFSQERPTAAGQPNEGWINTHYVDDGMTADNPHPSVPQCAQGSGDGGGPVPDPGLVDGGSPPAETKPPAIATIAGYFEPYKMDGKHDYHLRGTSTLNVEAEKSRPGKCSLQPKAAYDAANARLAANQVYRTLAGWSLGRVGVISYLKSASAAQLAALNYVLLIDPGSDGELSCDRTLDAGTELADWLAQNPRAHLAIISTQNVTQRERSKGIQEVYFNKIRDRSASPRANLRKRVLTCNYTMPEKTLKRFGRSAHERAMLAGQYWIEHEIGTSETSCPWLSEGGKTYKPTAGWNP